VTAAGELDARTNVATFLAERYPWLRVPLVLDDPFSPDTSAYHCTDWTGLLPATYVGPRYPDFVGYYAVTLPRWFDTHPWHLLIHELGHLIANVAGRTVNVMRAFLLAMGGDPRLEGDRMINEIFAEHFVRAWDPQYRGQDYAQLVGKVPFDAELMKAFCNELRDVIAPSIAPAPQIPQPAFVDIRSELARADFEIGRSTIRIGVAFHHTGSPDLDTSDPVRALQVLARYHRAKNWAPPEQPPAPGDGLMYHYAIAGGQTFLCRDIDAVLYATASDGNRTHYHCLFLSDPPSEADYEAARGLITLLGVTPVTHRSFGTSTCPGDVIAAWVENYREEDMSFTDEDRRKLDRVYAHAEAYEALDWIGRLQKWLGKALKSIYPAVDLSGPDVKTGESYKQ
jgi:hypothetical protein